MSRRGVYEITARLNEIDNPAIVRFTFGQVRMQQEVPSKATRAVFKECGIDFREGTALMRRRAGRSENRCARPRSQAPRSLMGPGRVYQEVFHPPPGGGTFDENSVPPLDGGNSGGRSGPVGLLGPVTTTP